MTKKLRKSDEVQRVYLTGVVDAQFVALGRKKLYKIMQTFPGSEIIVDINSPGGSIFEGLDLFGVIREASKKGQKVTTVASGFCASMGGVLLQAGDVRQIREDSHLHLHEALSMAGGNSSEIADAAALLEKLTRQMVEIYARKSSLTADEIHDRIKRQDWWLTAEEALAVGFVDEVI